MTNLQRFLDAQAGVYERAMEELRGGRKRSHWMWFTFPQIDGLGKSATAKFYAIKSLREAREYLDHPVLGARLVECSEVLLTIEGHSASEVFGFPDDLKLRSSMTLFEKAAADPAPFCAVLDRYFDGARDARTLELLG